MKRYWLFTGEAYYASGGMQDFIGSYDSLEQAIDDSKGEWRYSAYTKEDYFYEYDWFQILDSHESKIVSCSESQAHDADDDWHKKEVKFK